MDERLRLNWTWGPKRAHAAVDHDEGESGDEGDDMGQKKKAGGLGAWISRTLDELDELVFGSQEEAAEATTGAAPTPPGAAPAAPAAKPAETPAAPAAGAK